LTLPFRNHPAGHKKEAEKPRTKLLRRTSLFFSQLLPALTGEHTGENSFGENPGQTPRLATNSKIPSENFRFRRFS
jgi:hypothetical protein